MKHYVDKLGRAILLIGLAASIGFAYADSIVKNADGDYIITYGERLSGGTFQMLFIPATKIDPSVQTFLKLDDRVINYRYRIYNGQKSRQYLDEILLDPIVSIITKPTLLPKPMDRVAYVDVLFDAARNSMLAPQGWDADIIDIPNGFRLAWGISSQDPQVPSGFAPGTGSDSFAYRSSDLPGIAVMRLMGCVINPLDKYSKYDTDEMLDPRLDVAKQYHALEKNNFVPRNAAVPTIAVPTPFDAATLLDRIRTHFLTWQGKQLVEPAFASQLDRYLVAATEALRRNQIKAGKEHLETIHEMLEKEHKHLDGDDEGDEQNHDKKHRSATRPNIDRLAARVLDFDLKYVLKRLEEGKEKAEKKRD